MGMLESQKISPRSSLIITKNCLPNYLLKPILQAIPSLILSLNTFLLRYIRIISHSLDTYIALDFLTQNCATN